MGNKTLRTDFYELTMAQTYFKLGRKDEQLYFDLFFRKNPFDGGYTLSAGLDETIDYIKNLHFEDEEIAYLRKTGKFSEEFLDYLKDFKFTGDVYAAPDGTVVFPNEAVLTVKADAVAAQLIETSLLVNFNHGSLAMTKAKRITSAALGRPVADFGARRGRGSDSAVEASKLAYMGGVVGTSNTYAAMKYNIPPVGTMAHSLVTEADSEYDAFLGYAMANPDNCVFLVDTYNVLKSGIPNAIRVANEFLKPNGYPFKGIRIDSGDLAYLSKEARKMLDDAGYPDATICLTNGLDEHSITSLLSQGAKVDNFGVGDNLIAPNDRVGGVYKLVAVEKNGRVLPKIKVSEDGVKTINPGYKKTYRFYDRKTGYALGDVIALADEVIATDKFTLTHPVETWKKSELQDYTVRQLQVPIFQNGELVYEQPSLEEIRDYAQKEVETLYPEIRRLDKPHEYYVDLTDKLRTLKNELIALHGGNTPDGSNAKEKVYEKRKA